jgi:hypothetical protein
MLSATFLASSTRLPGFERDNSNSGGVCVRAPKLECTRKDNANINHGQVLNA